MPCVVSFVWKRRVAPGSDTVSLVHEQIMGDIQGTTTFDSGWVITTDTCIGATVS